jgi:predicted secreted hydrolase
MGEVGAVYEFTAKVTGRNVDTDGTSPLSVYIRAQDLTGIGQWGYGPSGFFPQWIYPGQRAAIMRNGGSVEKYLARSGDPMKGQGDYYYSSPLLQVQDFVVTSNDGKVSRGRGGTLWFDNVTQSFGEKAKAVVDSGVSWLEFSLQLPNTGQALKIGHVTQQATGNLPYAVMVDGDGAKARNGTILPTSRWDIGDVVVTPVRSSLWTSPKTGEKYYMKYKVRLKGATASTSADLVVTASFKNQEVVLGSSRTVYEGLFDFTGMVNGAKVSGTGWAEIQPAKSL